MKILIVHPQMALYAGAETVVVRLAHYLQQQGHKVSILTLSVVHHPDYESLEFILPKEDERIQYRLRGSIEALRDVYRMYQALRKLCDKYANSFDVISVHNFPAIWAVPSEKKIVWMCNEIPDLWHNRRIPKWLNVLLNAGRFGDRLITRSKHSTAVVADSKMAHIFQHRYCFLPNIIPYGIDTFVQTRGDLDGFRVLQPSMISPSKNQLSVLEAVDELRIPVTFAGYYEPRHPYTSELMQRAAGLDATFTGHINREKLRFLYQEASVAVFPGKGQGSWLGPFEALSAGVPVVVSPNLSCSELIAREELGIVTDDLVEALREIRKDYPRYQQQALRGREFVFRELTWDKFGAKMMELMT